MTIQVSLPAPNFLRCLKVHIFFNSLFKQGRSKSKLFFVFLLKLHLCYIHINCFVVNSIWYQFLKLCHRCNSEPKQVHQEATKSHFTQVHNNNLCVQLRLRSWIRIFFALNILSYRAEPHCNYNPFYGPRIKFF